MVTTSSWKKIASRLPMVLLFAIAVIITGCGRHHHSHASSSPSDITPPMVSSTHPANGATGVAINTAISAAFSETMDDSTLTTATFTLSRGTVPVSGTVDYNGTTALFTPDADLPGNTAFTATITTVATDAAGNALAADYVWSFTTGTTADQTAPMVSFTSPANGATGAAINAAVLVTFSETMKASTLTPTTFTLDSGGGPITGTVSYNGTTAAFIPSPSFVPNTAYIATITTGAKDSAGNPLAANYVWSFTTGAVSDITPPMVSFTSPASGAIGVAINAAISVTFNEPMLALSLTPVTFTLSSGTGPVTGAVGYSGTTATFTPSVVLTSATLYTATITTGVKDASGNPSAANYVWNFTTRATADATPPTVSSTSPANGATDAAINAAILAAFSETMNASTLTTATFLLDSGAGSVTGTVIYIGTTAVFTPSAVLAGNTTYTATITTGAKDAAGNALAADYVWSFTTGTAPDTTPPTVSSTNPVNNGTGVTVLTAVSATFSETMDASTLTTATFTLNSGSVTGTVDYIGTTVTFTPTLPLTGATIYTATITTGATDAAGNALAADYSWSFTTAVPEWQGNPPGTSLNFDPGQNTGETSIASDGIKEAVSWMETDTSGIYQIYVKQRNLTDAAWTSLGGSLNINTAHHVYEPFLAYYQGTLWAAWSECLDTSGIPPSSCAVSNVYARYWDGSNWLDPAGTTTPLNRDVTKNATGGYLRSDADYLYTVWGEDGSFQIKQSYVKRWDGSGWVDLGGSLNIDTTHNADERLLDVVEGQPYVIWTEESSTGNYRVYVKHWDGGSWVSDGGSLNVSLSKTAGHPAILNYGEIPYAAWHEKVSVGGTPVDQLFVKHFAGGIWVPDPDAGPGGTLNIDSTKNSTYPRMASGSTRLYLAWIEPNGSGIDQLYVKQFEAGVWSLVPGAGAGGSLNADVTHAVNETAITTIGEAVLVTWAEDNGAGVNQVYWKVYY